MTETVQEWVKRAQYDLETARAMLNSGRYFYVVFCCQQAVEKALKAVIIEKTGRLAPRIHNLPRLVDLAQVQLDDTRMNLMARLSAFYFQSRYPGKTELPDGIAAKAHVQNVLLQTEETVTWLLSVLK